jgi:hypothetical protein
MEKMSDDALIILHATLVKRAADGDYVSPMLFDCEDEMERRGLIILPRRVRHNLGKCPVE